MAGKGSFLSKFSLDPIRRAENKLREGKKDEAMELFAKGGEYRRAAKLAAELGATNEAVRFSVRAVLGGGAEAYEETGPVQAGEILATAGHHREAIALFELGQAYTSAAKSALKLSLEGRAARYFEQGRDWPSAALYYRRSGKLEDALRVLELESDRLRREKGPAGMASELKRKEIDLERAEHLSRLGRSKEAANLLLDLEPSVQSARIFEEAGNAFEAIRAYLTIGSPDKALRLLSSTKDLDPKLIAEVYRKMKRPEDEAKVLAAHGFSREAAEAFERAGDWIRAGAQWEAARDHLRAADAFRKAGRLSVAARCMADAGELSNAARMYEEAGDLSGAATCHVKAGHGLEAAQLFFKAGKLGAATQALSAVKADAPKYAEAAVLMAKSLVENEKYVEALAAIRRVPPERRERGPVAAECLYWGGRAFEATGQAPQARACYQKLIFMPEDHRDAASRLAELEVALGATMATAPRGGPPATSPPPPGDELPPGYVLLDRYEIQEELGKGGMGRVYRAMDRELEEMVAIKTLLQLAKQGSEEEARLVREVQICRRITHPNIVRIYDLSRFHGGLFVTMELLEGTSLEDLLKRKRQLPFSQVKGILAQILAGLAEAHSLGVVHRDLKPGNLFLAARRIKILDFGIARMSSLDHKLTQTGTTLGSPLYMSPEQLQGEELDGRSDLYSLGTLAYTTIAGQEPFAGRPVSAIFLAQMNENPPDIRTLRQDTPPAWMDFLGRLLAKDRDQRFASAQEVARILPELPQ